VLTIRRLIAAYPTEKHSSTAPTRANMPGIPGPSPMANASGTVPISADSGAAAATTRNTIWLVRSLRATLS
jgi:hypothetical protein